MQFTEESLCPGRQDPLIITAAPFGPMMHDAKTGFKSAFTSAQQLQIAADCLKAGASMLHLDFWSSEADMGDAQSREVSDRVGMLRRAVPLMLLQMDGPPLPPAPSLVAGSGRAWASDIKNLDSKPHFVTMEVSAGRPRSAPLPMRLNGGRDRQAAAQLGALRRNGIQPFFLLRDLRAIEVLEDLVRTGAYMGPLNHCMVAERGGLIGYNPIDWVEFLRRAPPGSKVAFQGPAKVAPPLAAFAIAFGIHIRVAAPGLSFPGQAARPDIILEIKRAVRTARQFGRKIATCDDARRILNVGTWYDSAEETLFVLGMLPRRKLRP